MLKVKVTGEDAVARYLKRLRGQLTQANAEADLLVAVEPMVQSVRANVPLGPDSIHLKDNITAAPDRAHARSVGWLASVAVGARRVPKIGEIFYLRFLEWGTVKQAPRPVLRPAFDSHSAGVTRRLAALLAKRVRAARRA